MPPAGEVVDTEADIEAEAAVDLDEDDNPEERLSTLLEQIAPLSLDENDDIPEETAEAVPDRTSDAMDEAFEEAFAEALAEKEHADQDRLEDEPAAEPTTRMAWPAPVLDDAGSNGEAKEGAESTERESRYRSRSAQLPRLGNQAKSNMTTMANLRKKSRGSND
jgi:hypothetical protein